jgi:Zn-dependent protease with chaperone function
MWVFDATPAISAALSQWITGCAVVPRLSYAPWDVGWAGVVLCALVAAAGVACVGLLGTALRWTADDPAPLRPLWMVLIVAGFLASAAGLYLALANEVHARAVTAWLTQASAACISAMSKSPNFYTSSLTGSVQLGAVAIACIALGVGGAAIERRRARPRAK